MVLETNLPGCVQKQKVKKIEWSNVTNLGELGKGSFSQVFRVKLLDSDTTLDDLDDADDDDDNSIGIDILMTNRIKHKEINNDNKIEYCGGAVVDKPSITASSAEYALKCLRPDITTDRKVFMMAAADLAAEGHILSKLEHENIIRLYGVKAGDLREAFVVSNAESKASSNRNGQGSGASNDSVGTGGGYFLLLEMLDGTLTDRLKKLNARKKSSQRPSRQFSAKSMELVCTVGLGVARGLEYMHSRGVVARDIKPDNIGFNRQGTPVIFDLGFAREVHTIDPTEVAGSLRYMAPEVALGNGTTCACDVYSFGVLLWQLCTLSKPFKKFNSRSDFQKKVFEEGYRPSLSPIPSKALRNLIASCWDVDPEKRPKMSAVVQALRVECVLERGMHIGSNQKARSLIGRKTSSRAAMSTPSLTQSSSSICESFEKKNFEWGNQNSTTSSDGTYPSLLLSTVKLSPATSGKASRSFGSMKNRGSLLTSGSVSSRSIQNVKLEQRK